MPRCLIDGPSTSGTCSWLLAVPQMIAHFRCFTVSWFSTAPSAHGARMSHSCAKMSLPGSRATTPSSFTERSTAAGLTSVPTTVAPWARRIFASR